MKTVNNIPSTTNRGQEEDLNSRQVVNLNNPETAVVSKTANSDNQLSFKKEVQLKMQPNQRHLP